MNVHRSLKIYKTNTLNSSL